MLRRTLTSLVVAVALCGTGSSADRKSWNKIRYIGGTIPVRTSPYDWNATLTVNSQPPSIVVEIAPASVFSAKRTVRIAASQVVSLSAGPAAWRRVGEVSGALLPARPQALFGLLQDDGYLGIVYRTEDGKQAAVLLEARLVWQMLPMLRSTTGKTVEESP
jgi:hypothetical protein